MLLHMGPQLPSLDVSHNRLGHSKPLSYCLLGCYASSQQRADLAHVCLCQLRARVVTSPDCFWVLTKIALATFTLLASHRRLVVRLVPRFAPTGGLRLCMAAVVLASAFVSSTSLLPVTVLHICFLCGGSEMSGVATEGVIAGVHNNSPRLLSRSQEVGDSVGEKSTRLWDAKAPVPLAIGTSSPLPALCAGPPVNLLFEGPFLFRCQFWYVGRHSPNLTCFLNQVKGKG